MNWAGSRGRLAICLLPPPFGHRWEKVEETSLLPPGDVESHGHRRESISVWRCKRCGKETWR